MNDSPPAASMIHLMTRAKAGDKAAFEEVYKSLFLPVYRYLNRRLKNTKDAEDLAQQVFLRVYASNTLFSNQSLSPLAYLFTVARNLLIDFWKKEKRFENQSIEVAETIPELVNQYQVVGLKHDLSVALDTLSAEWREVVELKFIHGLTTTEIAGRLGKTEANIRQIQCRALRQLRNHFV